MKGHAVHAKKSCAFYVVGQIVRLGNSLAEVVGHGILVANFFITRALYNLRCRL